MKAHGRRYFFCAWHSVHPFHCSLCIKMSQYTDMVRAVTAPFYQTLTLSTCVTLDLCVFALFYDIKVIFSIDCACVKASQ